ncbi:MAG: FGGY-family carbohydrate kinase [Candidatus Thorarchaeota archaeon]
MNDLICVFDVGTTGTRTIVFDIEGRKIAKAYEEYPVVKQPVGVSEQDPEIWWTAVKNTCKIVSKKVNSNDIQGICSSYARETATIVDKNGIILHRALTWMDERTEMDPKEGRKEDVLRRTIPKLLWFKNNKPELFNKAYKIVYPVTFVNLKLCGEYVTDPTNGAYGIMNFDTLEWDDNLAEFYDLPIELWPKLSTPGEIIGELLPEAANELGLKSNIPIILGGGDQQCAALGLGVIDKGQAKITLGTGTFVNYCVDKPIKPAGDFPIFSVPSMVQGKWYLEGSMPGTGTVLKWFKDNFSQLQIKECEEGNTNIYDLLAEEAKNIPPGSGGLLFLPLYMYRKGTIHGLGWNHTRAHMIRAIMESAALSAQMYLNMLEAMGGAKVTEIKVDGGAMNSDLWAQIITDILDKKVLIPEIKDGAALGAAILGFYGIKEYNSFESAIEKMVRIEKEFNPLKENKKAYKKLSRTFMPALLDIYEKKRITKDL